MSRSSFFSRTPSSHDRDQSPLLPQHRNSVSLHDLSPRSSHSHTQTSSRRASPSPPPSFYRDVNTISSSKPDSESHTQTLSSSPSRTKPQRKIQFTAPPPPIATSALLPPRHASQRGLVKGGLGVEDSGPSRLGAGPHIVRRGIGVDPLIVLERKERAIQQDLQLLLDAQSAGLVQGFGGGEAESDAGSSTPTSRSMVTGRRGSGSQGRSGGKVGIMPVRQPKGRTVGLRGARRGLLREMRELAGVKGDEMALLEEEIERRGDVLGRVDIWEKRIEGVRGQLNGAAAAEEDGEEDREIAELQNEEKAVENEIREIEDRLATMNARKRWLGERIKEGINRRDARLSSYRGALREAESEVKEFLRRPPILPSVVMGDEEGFASLPPGRRTLGMAKEWWGKEIERLKQRKGEVEKERKALEEGAKLWSDSIGVVVEFEDDLRKQMSSQNVQDVDMLKKQVSKMGSVIEKLEETTKIAEEKGWNLLICAVGAELEAFKQGEGILKGALEMTGGNTDRKENKREEQKSDGFDELNGGELMRHESLERDESEDDGPNLAELLVDHGDPDDTS